MKVDKILSYKTYLKKIKRIEVIQASTVEISNEKIIRKYQNIWRLNNTLETMVKEEVPKKV